MNKTLKSLLPTSVLTGLALLTLNQLTQAAVTVSNLGIPDGSNSWQVINAQYIGMSFTVGSDYSSWNLGSVDIRAFESSGSPTQNFIVELHADDGSGIPAVAALVTFTGGNPVTLGEYNFVPASPFTLSAGLTYWLTAESSASGSPDQYGWQYSNSSSSLESAALTGWSIGDKVAGSFNQGATWASFTASQSKFAVNATGVVPEPGSLGLLALGGFAAATRRRRSIG